MSFKDERIIDQSKCVYFKLIRSIEEHSPHITQTHRYRLTLLGLKPFRILAWGLQSHQAVLINIILRTILIKNPFNKKRKYNIKAGELKTQYNQEKDIVVASCCSLCYRAGSFIGELSEQDTESRSLHLISFIASTHLI